MQPVALAREAVAPLIAKFNESQDKAQDIGALAVSSYLRGRNQAGVIQIQVRQVYGVTQAYPANEQAQLLALIAGTKTLKPETLAYAERLGFRIEQAPQQAFEYRRAA